MRKIKTLLLLGGGDGTRFWPLQHKYLTPYIGRSLIFHILEQVSPRSDNVILVVNATLKTEIGSSLSQFSNLTIIVQERVEEGMAGAVLAAKELLQGEVLILNANDYFDFTVFEELLSRQNEDLTFVAQKIKHYFPGGYLKIQDDKVMDIVEKPDPEHVPSDFVKLTCDFFRDSSTLLQTLEETRTTDDDWYEQALTRMIAAGRVVGYVPYNGYWYSLKYPWQVLDIMIFFLTAFSKPFISEGVTVSPKAVVEGNVYIETGVKIGDFAKVVGPCYIGKNVYIADYALVRESHIGSDSIVGGYSEVTRSYVGNNVMLHRNYIGDSVLSNSILMGAEALTANYRFDESEIYSHVGEKKVNTHRKKFGAIIGTHSKIGVNATILPGVKIGSHTFIGPNSKVELDVTDSAFVNNGVIKDNTHR